VTDSSSGPSSNAGNGPTFDHGWDFDSADYVSDPVTFEDIMIVGETFDGPYYVLRDGTTVHILVPHSGEASED